MGTCYSKSGNELDASYTENRPYEKKKGSFKNGQIKLKNKPKPLVEDVSAVQTDVSDTVYTEDSHTLQAVDPNSCMSRSQQTSLDQLGKDANKNIETLMGFCETVNQSSIDSKDNEVTSAQDKVAEVQQNVRSRKHVIDDKVNYSGSAQDDVVRASDSGIVVEHCDIGSNEGCEQNVHDTDIDISDRYSKNFESNIENGTKSLNNTPSKGKQLKPLRSDFQPCLCSNSNLNDSRGRKSRLEHSSCASCHGECQGHFFPARSHINGSSESILKSSLKKCASKSRKKKGLSWKSADSLDLLESMATSLDRTKSVCSSILGDDISLLNAPLATFDSVDFAVGNSYDFSKHFQENSQNHVDYCSDTFQFQFDFSGLESENRRSLASLDRLSESHKSTDSTADLDKIKLALRHSTVSSPAEIRSLADSIDGSAELSSATQQPEVITMNMNGREVVVIDSELFSQIIDEIQFLKMKLSQLTEVIQDAEEAGSGTGDGVSVLSSSA